MSEMHVTDLHRQAVAKIPARPGGRIVARGADGVTHTFTKDEFEAWRARQTGWFKVAAVHCRPPSEGAVVFDLAVASPASTGGSAAPADLPGSPPPVEVVVGAGDGAAQVEMEGHLLRPLPVQPPGTDNPAGA